MTAAEILLIGACLVGFATDALNGFIESQIFFPDRIMRFSPADFGLTFEDAWIDTSDGVKLHGWWVPGNPDDAVVLFCHGNAGNISDRVDNVARLNRLGLNVLIFDYRGYGRSEGNISESGFYLDAEAAYGRARSEADKLGVKLVIFGRSLGGIAAVHMASGRKCSGIILESTFTNLGDMAKIHFPLPTGMLDLGTRFNAVDKIGGVNAPLLFFHGDRDAIVPFELGKALYEAAPEPKEFITLSGANHNDTYLVAGADYFSKWRGFIDGLPD